MASDKLIDVHPLYYKKKKSKNRLVAVTSLFAIMEGKEWSSFENRTVSRPWPPWCLVCLYSILASSGTLQRRSAYLSPSNTDDRSVNRVGKEAYIMAYKRFLYLVSENIVHDSRSSTVETRIMEYFREKYYAIVRRIGNGESEIRRCTRRIDFHGLIFFRFWPSSNLIFLFTRTFRCLRVNTFFAQHKHQIYEFSQREKGESCGKHVTA